MDIEKDFNATVIQSLARRYIVRKTILQTLNERYEKIYDPKRKKCFYYDTRFDTSSWEKPRLFLKTSDVSKLSSIYSRDEAATVIQSRARGRISLHRVRILYQSCTKASKDPATGNTFYYNSKTRRTMWQLPTFMSGKLNYGTQKAVLSASKSFKRDEDDSIESKSDISEDSETVIKRRRMNRKFPRSKSQLLVDTVEDDMDEQLSLDLSGIGARHITSRIYDFSPLTALNLSGNRLRRLSDDIQYLASLTTLDISHNMISKIPKEIDELVQLKELRASHNHLETYPGHLYKLRKLKVFDMSYNRFKAIPIETGNLELLKELNQWDVGVGVLISLTTLDFSHCLLTDWPPQLENLAQLTHLNLSHNSITAVPSQISALVSLKVLDLSNNQINSLSENIYLQSITELLLNDNQLTALPPFTSVQNQTMSSLIFINLGNNKITSLSEQLFLFHHVEKFLASFNCIESVHDSVASMKALKYLDLSHNQLVDITNGLLSCNRLTYLDLSYNRLTRVPLALSGTNRMLELYLQHNEISDISGKVYAMMMDLKRLRLDHNRLSHLAPLFYTMKKLEYLNLSHNQLVVIEESIGLMKSLNELYLNVNKLSAVPEQICVLTQLTCLEMEHNRIAHLPLQLSQLKNLRRITLHSNVLQLSPHLLTTLPFLLHCNLSWNKLATASTVNKNYKYKTEYISMELLKGKLDQAHLALDDALSQSLRPRILFRHEQSEGNGDDDVLETDVGEDPDDGQASSEGKKPKRKKKKTSGNQIEQSQAWFVQLQEYFRIFGDDDESLEDIQLLENMTKDLLIQHQTSEQLNRCRLQLRSILAVAGQYGRSGPNGISLNDYVRFDGASMYSSTDADDVSAASVLNALDWGADYQELIDQFQRCSHEVAALAIVEELQCLQANSAALSSGKAEIIIPEKETDNSKSLSSRFFSFKKEKEPTTTTTTTTAPEKLQATSGATSKVANNSSDMEEISQATVQKKNIIDFGRLPFIYNFSPPEVTPNLRGKLSEMLCSCYLGLGRALLGRAEKLRDDIREVEIRGKLRTSCLDIAQRRGDDFADIIKDYYDKLVARAATIAAGKDDDDGGEDGPAEGKAPVPAKRRSMKKPVITLSSTPAIDGLDDTVSAGGDDSEAVSDASGGGDRKHKKKGKASKSKHKAKHKEKEKDKDKPVAKPKPVSAVKKRNIPLKELLRSTAFDELLRPVPWKVAHVCVDYLSKNRLLTLLWAMKCLEAVSEILTLSGWDPRSALKAKNRKLIMKSMSENNRNDSRDDGNGETVPEWVRLAASQIHLMKAKLFGYLRWYKEAESELKIYLSMLTTDAPKSTMIFLIKIYIAQGNYFLAQKAVNALVDKLALAAEREKSSKMNKKQSVVAASAVVSLSGEVQLPPSLEMDIMNIIKLDKEVGLLKCIADAYMSSLRSEGFLSPEQMQIFRVQDNGLLSMNGLYFAPESLNGRSLRDEEVMQGRLDRKQVELAREAEAAERENVNKVLQKCIEMARNVLLIPI